MSQEPTTGDVMTAIVDLHGAMLHGFAQVDLRFERMETRLDGVETRLDRVESRLDHVETELTSLKGEFNGVRAWMARSDRRFAALESRR